ncbi:MAG: hypothetical protein ABI409_03940 [Ramlibacter sp.]
MLNWIVNDKQIEPHIPVWEKSQRDDETFNRSDFQFDEQSNSYECPAGKQLTTTGRPTSESTVLFRARNEDCASCAHKQRRCPNTPHLRIARSIYEGARDVARTVCTTPAYKQSCKDRRKVEMLLIVPLRKGLVCEIGNIQRFASARQLMGAAHAAMRLAHSFRCETCMRR